MEWITALGIAALIIFGTWCIVFGTVCLIKIVVQGVEDFKNDMMIKGKEK